MHKKQLLIVVHSQSGRNMQLALQAFTAAQGNEHIQVRLLRACEACALDVQQADALLLITPETLAAVSGGMKEFIDRVFYPLERAQKQALAYAAIIGCGNAGDTAAQQLDKIMSGIRAKKIQQPLIVHGQPDAQALANCAELAQALVAGLEMGIF